LNVAKETEVRSWSGSEFQVWGPANENARRP